MNLKEVTDRLERHQQYGDNCWKIRDLEFLAADNVKLRERLQRQRMHINRLKSK